MFLGKNIGIRANKEKKQATSDGYMKKKSIILKKGTDRATGIINSRKILD